MNALQNFAFKVKFLVLELHRECCIIHRFFHPSDITFQNKFPRFWRSLSDKLRYALCPAVTMVRAQTVRDRNLISSTDTPSVILGTINPQTKPLFTSKTTISDKFYHVRPSGYWPARGQRIRDSDLGPSADPPLSHNLTQVSSTFPSLFPIPLIPIKNHLFWNCLKTQRSTFFHFLKCFRNYPSGYFFLMASTH